MIMTRAIIPAHPFKSSIFRADVDREAKAIGKAMLGDFERTTATWKRKVKFVLEVKAKGIAAVAISITTTDEIYQYVNKGTKAHWIVAHTRKGLIFRPDSKPKTEPEVILSTAGEEGSTWRRKQKVRHPGIKARKFSATIKRSYRLEFKSKMQAALNRAARRTRTGKQAAK